MLGEYSPILIQLLFAIGFGLVMIIGSSIFGKLGSSKGVKDSAYECGMLPIGSNRPRFSVKFYVIAMLFVLFDIEVVFLYPWALNYSSSMLTDSFVYSIITVLIFISVLFVAYIYVLKKGVLDWNK